MKCIVCIVLLVVLGSVGILAQQQGQQHHFALPTRIELQQACAVMKGDSRWPLHARIVSMGYKDQPKDSLLRHATGSGPRSMQAVVFVDSSQTTYEFAVDVRRMRVEEVVVRNRVQPALTQRDAKRADSVVRAHGGWKQALERRNLQPIDVVTECRATGSPITGFPQRLVYVVTYHAAAGKARYDAPVHGLRCLVDVMNARVMLLNDAPVASVTAPFKPVAKESKRSTRMRPTVAGRKTWTYSNGRLEWEGWSCSPMLTPYEGLVLYDVRRTHADSARRVAWRVSVAELLTARLDTNGRPDWEQEFVAGEQGLGVHARSLSHNADVPSNATLLSTASVADNGSVQDAPNVIGIYECDAGATWQRGQAAESAGSVIAPRERVRELVVVTTSRIHGLEYTVSYILRTDGSLSVDVGVDGTLASIADRYIHAICTRMDVDVNGEANSLEEIDVMYGRNQLIPAVGLRADTFALRYEQEARRQRDDVHMRTWRISGPNATGFSVITNSAPHAPLLQTMVLRRRSEFTRHDVWTTTYKPTELFAAGLYPNQADDIGGLPLYVKDNTSIARQDIVLWHSMGLLTIPSANDIPSMRTRQTSVTLLPSDAISLTR